MASARKSIMFSAVANFTTLGFGLVLLVIVTRWLQAAEIGAFVFASAIYALIEPVRMFQLIAYVIQAEELTEELMKRTQFVGLTMSICAFLVTMAIAGVLWTAFDTPDVGNLLAIMSFGYLIRGFTQPALAVVSRQMQFGFRTWVAIVGAVAKVAVTVGLLVAGLRAEALAIGVVAEIVPEIAYLFRVERRFALQWPNARGSRPVWSYCSKFSASQLLVVLPNSAVDLLIGSFLGLASAGHFNRAGRLVRTIRSGIEATIFPVALAVFSDTRRENRAGVRTTYLNGVSMLTGVTWPALLLIIVTAKPLVLAAYGPRWEMIVPLVQILSLSAIVFAATAMAPPLFASIGAVDSLLRRNLLIQIPRIAIAAAAVHFGLTAVAWGAVITQLLANIVTEHILRREIGITYRQLATSLWRSAAVSICSALAAALVLCIPRLSEQGPVIALACALAGAGAVWVGAIYSLRHPLRAEAEMVARRFL